MKTSLLNPTDTGADSFKLPKHCAAAISSRHFADIFHEVRTPLGAVQGLSRLALDRCETSAVRTYLGAIDHATADLLELLNNALECARVEADGIRLNEQAFDLPELVEHLHTLFCGIAQCKGLFFSCSARIAQTLPPVGDRLRIQQVLINLLSNAMKFTTSGGVWLDVDLEPCGAERATLACQVRDTGLGMDWLPSYGKFQRYCEAAGSIPTPVDSCGLGLAICQDLLQMMNSNLEFESHPGQGSRFRFAISLAVTPGTPAARTAPLRQHKQLLPGALGAQVKTAGQALTGLRVLIADDNPIEQRILQEFLHMAGIQTTLASNGRDVLQLLQQERFDALLLDTHMPEMGGVEVAQTIAAQPGSSTMQVIALTADTSPLVLHAYQQARVAAVLTKPADPLVMLEVLARNAPHAPKEAPLWDLKNLRLQLGYQEETVQALLKVFKRQALQNYHAMTDLIREARLEEAASLAHTISGAAGNIGALALHSLAANMVVTLQTVGADPAVLDRFQRAFDQTIASMPLTTRQPDVFTPVNHQELESDLRDLEEALTEQYFISNKTLDNIRRNLSPEHYSLFDLVCEYAQDLRYRKALQLLKVLRA